MDGTVLNNRLRELPHAKEVPIFALSGFLSQLSKDSHPGFTTFLSKPIDSHYLLNVVKAHLPALISKGSTIGKGKRILIADDNPIQLKLFGMQLRNAGFEVISAEDGLIALEKAKTMDPEVIISDILMPNMDGFSLCTEIKRDPKLRTIPVRLLTSHYLAEEDLELAKKVGASCYLTKTPDEKKLILELVQILDTKLTQSSITPFEFTEEIKEKHTIRTICQLEQQVLDNAQLEQHCALLITQLSLITGIANTLKPLLE